MPTVNMLEAKTNLSRLVDQVESGAEKEIVIARNGRPAARLVALNAPEKPKVRLGMLEGKYAPMSVEDLDASNDEIARLFYGEGE